MKKVSFKHKPIHPKSEKQQQALESSQNLILHGVAGTGKSFLALVNAMTGLKDRDYQEIVLFRSAVATRDVGFLPGSETEKGSVYEEPYRELVDSLYGEGSYEGFKDKGLIKFRTTSYVRGLTIDNAVIIIEECQNLTFHEFDSLLTRVGENTKVIITGDTAQSDLRENGLREMLPILRSMSQFEFIEFGIEDIVRSGFVRDYLIAKYDQKSRTQ